jgi:hypothetical protein
VNANPLAASIFSATTAGTVQHEIVKKDVDCIIAEVDRDGMCVYMCSLAHVYICARSCVCMCVLARACVYVCSLVCVYMCARSRVCIYVLARACVCVCSLARACVCVCCDSLMCIHPSSSSHTPVSLSIAEFCQVCCFSSGTGVFAWKDLFVLHRQFYNVGCRRTSHQAPHIYGTEGESSDREQ